MNKTLGNYQIMIASKYFDSIDDFINIEIAVKRFRGNMERFHFNPIPLDDYSRKLFPNLETLHLYDENDQVFDDGRIFKYCIWCYVSYDNYFMYEESENEFKNICYTKEDREKYGNEIPDVVKILWEVCFEESDLLEMFESARMYDENENGNILHYDERYGYQHSGIESYDDYLNNQREKRESLKTIEIPNSVKEIWMRCFDNCTKLESVIMSDTVCEIGKYCFNNCQSLTSITLPNTIEELTEHCFSFCDRLKSIIIPNSVSKLGKYCFKSCYSLESIVIPNSVIEIEDCCFSECVSLKSVLLPNSISYLSDSCFFKCTSITSITIPDSVTEFDNYCFSECDSLQTMNIPESVIKLGNLCFSECYSLLTITISSSIEHFGESCFYNCFNLETNPNIPNICFNPPPWKSEF